MDGQQENQAAESAESEKEITQKSKELFSLAQAAFNYEDSRFDRIDDMALKYVPIVVFLATAEGVLAKWGLENLVPPKSLLEGLALLYIGTSLIFLLVCVAYLLKSLGFRSLKVAYITPEHVSYFDEHDLATIYRGYGLRYMEDRNFNSNIINKKAATLHWSYSMIGASSCFLILSATIYVIHTCLLRCNCTWVSCWPY